MSLRKSKKFPKFIHKLDVLLNQVCLSRAQVESKFLMVYTHDVVNNWDSEVLLTVKGAWLLPMTMVCHQSRQIT